MSSYQGKYRIVDGTLYVVRAGIRYVDGGTHVRFSTPAAERHRDRHRHDPVGGAVCAPASDAPGANEEGDVNLDSPANAGRPTGPAGSMGEQQRDPVGTTEGARGK